jgi:hypothetical protein
MQACYAAFKQPQIRYNHIISCVPGTEIITNKGWLPITLRHTFGTHYAYALMPPSFSLPDQYLEFATYIRQTNGDGTWALKEDVHRGEGIVTAPGPAALWMAFDQNDQVLREPHSSVKRVKRSLQLRYALAQKFVTNQYIIDGRPSVLRVWAVVSAGNSSVRGYLFKGGILPFGSPLPRKPDEIRDSMLIVNLFKQNRSIAADPWSLEELRTHIEDTADDGKAAFKRLWNDVRKSTAAVLASAVQSIQSTTSRLECFQGGAIEVMGLDFVIDSSLEPWMIEINYLPSMARKVIKCTNPGKGSEYDPAGPSNLYDDQYERCVPNAMDAEKEAFLKSLLRMVRARHSVSGHNKAATTAALSKLKEKNLLAQKGCNVSGSLLSEVLDAEAEVEGAKIGSGAHDRGFDDLTPAMYGALRCIHGRNYKNHDEAICKSVFPERYGRIGRSSPGVQQGILAHLVWAVAQIRRATAKFEALFGLEGKPMLVLPPISDEPFLTNEQRLVAAWLQSRHEDRQGASPSQVLERLCSIND